MPTEEEIRIPETLHWDIPPIVWGEEREPPHRRISQIIKCADCERELQRGEAHIYNDKGYCPFCFHRDFFYCCDCNNVFKRSEYVDLFGNLFCKECAKKQKTKCKHCGKKILKFQSVRYEHYYCRACYDLLFMTCPKCCCTVPKDKSRNYQGENLCERCYRFRNFHSYEYRPQPQFYSMPKDKNEQLFFGIELEIEYDEEGEEECLLETIDKLPPFVYAKHDGTIEFGFEIVSHPATWNWLKQNYRRWENILNLRKDGYKSFDTTTCGMHVHLSKNAFSSLHLYKILKFFYENQDFILNISQRVKHNLDRYATLTTQTIDDRIIVKAMNKSQVAAKYTAINLLNEPTIEIRIFRGTLNPLSFWKNLEFIKAIIDWTRNISYQSVNVAGFLTYVGNNRKEYINLYNFIHRNRKKLQYKFERD